MDKDKLLKVGIITSAHGVRGEVNVFPTTDDPKRFKKLKKVFLQNPKNFWENEIEQVKFFKQMVILKFKDINDRDDAEKLKKTELFVDRENAVKLSADEYFIADLIGAKVYDVQNNSCLGELTDVLQTGANDVYEIEVDEGYLYKDKPVKEEKIYIPAIKECIVNVDISNNRLDIKIMPGLFEE